MLSTPERVNKSRSRTSIGSAQSLEFSDTEQSTVTAGRWDDLPEHLRVKESSHNPHHHDATIVPFSVKFGLLFCKDIKLAMRRKKFIGAEVVFPVFCVALLSIYVGVLNFQQVQFQEYSPFNPGDMTVPFQFCNKILFAPNTPFVNEIKDRLDFVVNGNSSRKRYTCEVVETSNVNQTASNICGALVFHTNFTAVNAMTEFPKSLTYEIRLRSVQRTLLTDENRDRPYTLVSQWSTGEIHPRELATGPREKDENTGGRPGYFSEGFLYIQQQVDMILIQLISIHEITRATGIVPGPVRISIVSSLERFPYPPFHNADIVHLVNHELPVVLLVGAAAVALVNTWLLVEEKLSIQWFVKTFGVSQGIQWSTWVLREMLIHSVVFLIITGLLFTDWHWSGVRRIGFIDQANPAIFYIFLMAFYFNTLCNSIVVSVFFSDPKNALTAAAFLNIFYFMPFIYFEQNFDLLPLWLRYLFGILGPTGLAFGCQQFALAELNVGGANWSTIFAVSFGLGHIIILMIIGGLFNFWIALYIRNIYPTTKNEVRLPLLFPFKKWWWKGYLPPDDQDAPIDDQVYESSEFFEVDPPQRRRELQVHRLSKCFPRDVGIFNINMNFFEGETSVILGGHLSGKSTFVAVVTGHISPTRGTITINKHNVTKEAVYARSNLGLCPQDDLLYDYLTVEETVSFFVQLKGVIAISEAFEEVGRLCKDLNIDKLRKIKVAKLSWTHKRLVQIAVAFSGGSKVVILDEPTTNMDHASKRIVWRFLEKEKERRCIVVLTKSAEETYFLADRMAILVSGEIHCRGSLNFISAKYGGGYHLTLNKSHQFRRFKLKTMLARMVPDAFVETDNREEIVIFMPRESTPAFPAFLEELESVQHEIGYETYKISHKATEEVYRKACKQNESQSKQEFLRRHTVYRTDSEALFGPDTKEQKYNKLHYCWNQFTALLLKNVRFVLRRWAWFVLPFFLPVIILASCAYIITTDPFDRNLPALNLDERFIKAMAAPNVFIKCARESRTACDLIQEVLANNSFNVEVVTRDIEEKIIESYDTGAVTVASTHMMAVDVGFLNAGSGESATTIRTYFNNQPLHVPPIAVNLISNAILQIVGFQNFRGFAHDYKISVINFPLEYTNLHKLGLSEYFWSSGFFFGLSLSWGMTFLLPVFIILPIRERMFKHLQIISGANLAIFWAAKLTWDIFCFSIVGAILCLITFYFRTDGFNNEESIVALAILLLIFGICSLGIVNCLVPLFKRSSMTGYFYTWFVFFVIGPVPMSVFLQQEQPIRFLQWLFLPLPSYAFGIGVFQMYSFSRYRVECVELAQDELTELCRTEPAHGCCIIGSTYHAFGNKGIGANDTVLIIVGLFAHLFSFFMDTQLYHTVKLAFIRWRLESHHGNKIEDIPAPPQAEHNLLTFNDEESIETQRKEAAESGGRGDGTDLNIINLSNLPGEGVLNELDLLINKDECLGIIGAAKSGSENIIPMLAGLAMPATGDVCIEGGTISLTKNYKRVNIIFQYLTHLGYCQEYPTLMTELTGKETLELFGTLRSVSPASMHAAITRLSLKLLLVHELENLVAYYNPSCIKKLAMAIALIGSPDYLLFDDPMNEIDTIGREQVLSTLISRKATAGVIIAAKSVDVCEQICDRLAIMVNGKIRCAGSPDYLREAFCSGYTITAKLIPDDPQLYEITHKMYDRDARSTSIVQLQDFDSIPKSKPSPIFQRASSVTSIRSAVVGRESFMSIHDKRDVSPSNSQGKASGPVFLATDSVLLSHHRQVTLNLGTDSGPETETDIRAPRFSRVAPTVTRHSIFMDPRLQFWEKELIPLMDFIENAFPGAELVNIYPCFVHYHIQDGMELSYIFRQMEQARVLLDLEGYTVGKDSLEQVCINFIGAQKVHKDLTG